MRTITQSDIEFLKALQHEMNTQEHDVQAAPRFWAIAQEEKYAANSDSYDGCIVINNEGSELGETLGDVKYWLKTNIDEESFDSLNLSEFNEDDSMEDIARHLDHAYPDEGYRAWYYSNVHVVKESTFFLTKRECKEHIEANDYHYNDTVHSYAMTAWRSPQVEALYELLENVDFNGLTVGETNV